MMDSWPALREERPLLAGDLCRCIDPVDVGELRRAEHRSHLRLATTRLARIHAYWLSHTLHPSKRIRNEVDNPRPSGVTPVCLIRRGSLPREWGRGGHALVLGGSTTVPSQALHLVDTGQSATARHISVGVRLGVALCQRHQFILAIGPYDVAAGWTRDVA